MTHATTIPMNDLSRALDRDKDALTRAAQSVFDSGHVVMGPQHDAFQDALAEYWGVDTVLGVASGTDALELAIRAAMPAGKSAVLTAANAGGYTSVAARRAGFRVRYADVDAVSLCVSGATVAEAMDGDVGVVVVTHLYGNVTEIDDLVREAHRVGVRVVEDWAQSIGARKPNGTTGITGDIAATSFYPTKNLGAVGDGGAVATNAADFARTLVQLRQYGWDTKYHVAVAGGTNSRLDELQAAFLNLRLPMLDSFGERRRYIVERYARAAQGGPIRVLPASGPHHVGHLAVARTGDRASVRTRLSDLGVSSDIHYPIPDHRQPGFQVPPLSLPVTELAAEEIFSLPCFPELTDDEVDAVCTAIEALK
ncbi:DegT/DnrJ/EryC1/StrS family aminotransferase [Lacisediminihabitans sp. H27-G8]|uniref:DegT/DnrJ/EryC1/StrS family aminotransferase n=1 Tax=Lacisediminihabitans sp. H27-G8 TaxID=3111909 RepID=UPI0038FCD03B